MNNQMIKENRILTIEQFEAIIENFDGRDEPRCIGSEPKGRGPGDKEPRDNEIAKGKYS